MCWGLLSMGFSGQDYWSGVPFPSLGDLYDPGIKLTSLVSPTLAGGFLTTAPPGNPYSSFLSSALFSSVAQLCPTLCDPMNRSTPGLPFRQLPEFTQTHDAIRPSHPLSSPSPPAPNPSQYQGLFQWVNSLHEVAKVLEFQLQHQSFQWIFRVDFL